MPAAAVGLVGAMMARSSAKRATGAIAEGAATSLEQQERFFDIGQENFAPYMEIGEDALSKIDEVFIQGNMDEFFESADYKFNLAEGEKALSRKQGAAGSRYGGSALKEATQFAQGTASKEFGNFFSRLNTIAGLGQASAAGSARMATTTGAGMGRTSQLGGMALAESYGNQNEAIQSGLSNVVSGMSMYDALKTTQPNYASGNVTSMPSIFNT